jgi:WhiB family redox-sensing transcriptional regulator
MPDVARPGWPPDPVDSVALFDMALARPAWHARASCRDRPDVNFFPERGEPVAEALRLCSACPVRAPCREFAESYPPGELPGVWGGTTALARRRRPRTEPSLQEVAAARRARVVELSRAGTPARVIAAEVGVSQTHVFRLLARLRTG